MTQANVVAIRFADSSQAFEALAALRRADADGLLIINRAAVVQRNADGSLDLPVGEDNTAGSEGHAVAGGVIGSLVGLLGGPVGLLFFTGAGAAIGASIGDDDDAVADVAASSAVAEFSRTLEPGSSALLADLIEPSTAVLDNLVGGLGATVNRRSTALVIAETEAAQEAAEAAAKEADRVLRDEQKAEKKAERQRKRDAKEADRQVKKQARQAEHASS